MTDEEKKIPEEKHEAPPERAPLPRSTQVRSCWLWPIDRVVLLESEGRFFLMAAEDWPRKKEFRTDVSVLSKPDQFNSLVPDENLWRAGVVLKTQSIRPEAVAQAIWQSGVNVSVDEVIEKIYSKD